MRFGFVGPMYQSPTPLAAAEQLINWRPQKIESPNARVAFALLPTSGLLLFAALGGPSVRGAYTVSGRVFFVSGTHLYEVSANQVVTDYGGAATLNNNIVDDGLPASLTSAGTVGGVQTGNPLAISSATISSPTTAQITIPSTGGIVAGATVLVAGITNPLFLQLNGTWTVASVASTTQLNLTTVALTSEIATALSAGTATVNSVGAGAYPSQLLIASGGGLTVFSLVSNAYQPITTPPIEVLAVDFLDGFFIALSAGNTWSVSNPEDATTWPGIAVSEVSVFSDQLTGLIASNRLLWLFGAKRAVGYYNSGAPLFPFDVASGAFMEVGLVAQSSPARVATHGGTTIMWLGGDERGQGVVYAANGFIPQRVSDSGFEYWMSQQMTISDAVGMARQEEGQNFYDLWFPTANATWTLDVDLGYWHRRTSLIQGVQAAHLSRCHVAAFGLHLVGDRTSGNVYQMSSNFFTDNGQPIIRTRVGPTVSLEGGQLTVPINEFQVDFETGLASLVESFGFGSPPQPPQTQAIIQTNSLFAITPTGSFTATVSNNFVLPTTAGNALICCIWAGANDNSPNNPTAPTIALPVTPGITWKLAGYSPNPGVEDGVFGHRAIGSCAIFVAFNVPTLAPTVFTSVTATTTLATSSCQLSMEVFEVSGSLGQVNVAIVNTGNTGTPTSGSVVTTASDFILEMCATAASNGGSNSLAVGPGFTISAPVYGCNAQYILNAPAGTYPTAYGSAWGSYWSTVTIGLNQVIASGGGAGSGGKPRDPYAMFSYSEDFGKTFTPERMIPCGQAGNFKVVAIDRRLGSWRSWTPKVTVSDPIPWRISDAYVNGTEDQQDRLAKTFAKIT